jgi:hypothetical protein
MQDDRLEFDRRRQNRELLRSKGEEVYELIGSFESSLRVCLCDLSAELVKQGSYQVNETFGGLNFTESKRLARKVSLLIRTYFPSALPHLEKLMSYESLVSACASSLLDPNESANEAAKVLVLISLDVDENAQSLQGAIVSLLQELHQDPSDQVAL